MPEIKYTQHLKIRLKVRRIPSSYPRLIFEAPEERFFDNLERTKISLKRLKYNGKVRNMMIAYNEKPGKAEIITVHPISNEKIINRVMSGRWSKNG